MPNYGEANPGIRIDLVSAVDQASLDAAIRLGDAARKNLGLLPRDAYADAARRQTLLGAWSQDVLVAYVLFRLPRRQVALTHLCVDGQWRGRGIARALVDQIAMGHRDRHGIMARCRNDYGLEEMWRGLGFQPLNEVRGRGRQPRRITVWWRDLGHPHLFSPDEDAGVLKVAIDLVVFRDLYTDKDRLHADESQALTADHLAGQVDLVVTPELTREVRKVTDTAKRRRGISAVGLHEICSVPDDHVDQLITVLTDQARLTHAGYPVTENDRSDLRHVAEAAAAGVTVFATRDDNMIRDLGPAAADLAGVRVLRPSDVIVLLDELSHADSYRPAALLGTDLRSVRVGAGGGDDLAHFADTDNGESRSQFLATLRAAAVADGERRVIYDGSQRPVLVLALHPEPGRLVVRLFRTAPHPLADTLARQMLYLLRQECRTRRLAVLTLQDRYLCPEARRAAALEGMSRHNGGWTALVIDRCDTAQAVEQDAHGAAAAVGIHIDLALRQDLSAAVAGEVERALWPAKVIDSEMPTYLISVQPRWSVELFGVPESLLPRSTTLGISREHVYYRASTSMPETFRILWYVSASTPSPQQSGVIACSQADHVLTDEPAALHRRFQYLGVWELAQIQTRARNGRTQAIRFVNTEIFPNCVPFRRLRNLAHQFGQPLALPSPTKISAQLFAAIYREGVRAG